MTEEKIQRINELARKSKRIGLSEAEKAEQARLRQEFLADIRRSVASQMDNIDIQEADGSITNVGEKYKSRHKK